MPTTKNWVSNRRADRIVKVVQLSIAKGRPNQRAIQLMMDLISGVENYSIYDKTRQGVIRRIFDSESSKFRFSRAHSTSNFSIDMDDVISTFWENVHKYLDRAQVTGGSVAVRVVNGQDASQTISKGGLTFTNRNTNCNPVHYLRKMGIMGVRNLINATYRRNLTQICEDCSHSSVASRIEVETACPKCQSDDSQVTWPDGSSSYRAKKARVCNGCKNKWLRKFAYACSECKSANVRIESLYETADDETIQIVSEEVSVDDQLITIEAVQELDKIMKMVYDYLPSDPKDKTLISKTKDIFSILVDAKSLAESAWMREDICKKCVLKAPKVCPEKCGQAECAHALIPDPKISCGATTFSIAKCINFSKKIGEYQGCSASLTARRMKKIRQYFVRFVKTHRDQHGICDSLYTLMESRGLLSQY